MAKWILLAAAAIAGWATGCGDDATAALAGSPGTGASGADGGAKADAANAGDASAPVTDTGSSTPGADGSTAPIDGGPPPPATRPPSDGTYRVERDVLYVPGSNPAWHAMDLYVPGGAGPFPTLVYLHGGGWFEGGKADDANLLARQAGRGYVVASINYRLTDVAQWPAQMLDAKAAVRFLRANAAQYGIDATRIAAWGSSAGAHLAAILGVSGGVAELEDGSMGNASQSSRVRAVVDWYGPTDFLQMDGECNGNHDAADSPESKLVGCQIQTCPDKVRRASPITYVDATDPPVLMMHGSIDCTVPPGQSQIFDAALEAQGVREQLHILPGLDHNFVNAPTEAMWKEAEDFLDASLDP